MRHSLLQSLRSLLASNPKGRSSRRRVLRYQPNECEALEDRTLLTNALQEITYRLPGTFLENDLGGDDDAHVPNHSGIRDKKVPITAAVTGRVQPTSDNSHVAPNRVWIDFDDDMEWDSNEPFGTQTVTDGYTDFFISVSESSHLPLNVEESYRIAASFDGLDTIHSEADVEIELVDPKFSPTTYSHALDESCSPTDIRTASSIHYRNSDGAAPIEIYVPAGGNATGVSLNGYQVTAPNGLRYVDGATRSFELSFDGTNSLTNATVNITVNDVTPTIQITGMDGDHFNDAWPTTQWVTNHLSGNQEWTLYTGTQSTFSNRIANGNAKDAVDLNGAAPFEYGTYTLKVEDDSCVGSAEDTITFQLKAAPVFTEEQGDINLTECDDPFVCDGNSEVPLSFDAMDPDGGDIVEYKLAGPDDDYFNLVQRYGDWYLEVTGDLDHEDDPQLSIGIIAKDNEGDTVRKNFKVNVADVATLAAPELVAPTSDIVSLGDLTPQADPEHLRIDWDEVAGANGYRVVVKNLTTGQQVITEVTKDENGDLATEYLLAKDELQKGHFYRIKLATRNCDNELGEENKYEFLFLYNDFKTDVVEDYAEEVCNCPTGSHRDKQSTGIGPVASPEQTTVSAVGDATHAPATTIVGGAQQPQTDVTFLPAQMTALNDPVIEIDMTFPTIVVPATVNLDLDLNVPDALTMKVTILNEDGGPVMIGDQEFVFTREITGIDPGLEGEEVRIGLQIIDAELQGLPTGTYLHRIEVEAAYGDEIVDSQTYEELRAVIDHTDSEYGNGWWLPGLDRLFVELNDQEQPEYATIMRGNGTNVIIEADNGSFDGVRANGSFVEIEPFEEEGELAGYRVLSAVGTIHTFNPGGVLQSIEDSGQLLAMEYRSNGTLEAITDSRTGRTTTFSFTGTTVGINDFVGRNWTLTKDSEGRVTHFAGPAPDVTSARPTYQYSYDGASDLPESFVDPLGRRTTYAFDEFNKLNAVIVQNSEANPTDSVTWTIGGQHSQILSGLPMIDDLKSTITFPDNTTTTREIDRYGQTIHLVDRIGLTTEIIRDEIDSPGEPNIALDGHVRNIIGPYSEGDVDRYEIAYTYDDYRLRKIEYPDGTRDLWHYNYSTDGRAPRADQPSRYINRVNQVIDYLAYDDTNIEDSEGSIVNRASGLVQKQVHRYGSGAGSDVDIAHDGVYEFTYQDGLLTRMVSPRPGGGEAVETVWTYFPKDDPQVGSRGQLKAIYYPDRNFQTNSPHNPSESFTYGAAGFLSTATDAAQFVTRFNFDQLGRMTSMTLPEVDGVSPTYQMYWSALGNPDFTVDPLGRTTDYTFDYLDRLDLMVLPDPDGAGPLPAPLYDYGYDASWQLSTIQDVAGVTTYFEFDAHGSPIWESIPIAPDDTFSADTARTHYAVDSLARTTEIIIPVRNDGETRSTKYEYDDSGRKVVITDALENETTFKFDPIGRQKWIESADPDGSGPLQALRTEYDYADTVTDSLGRKVAITSPDQVTVDYYIGPAGELVQTRFADPTPDDGIDDRLYLTYDYDAMGRVLQEHETSGDLTRRTIYTYDPRGYVDRVKSPKPADNSRLNTVYEFNGWGLVDTVTSPDGVQTRYTYNADASPHEIRTIGVADDDGNSPPDQVFVYSSYDALGRVTQTQAPDGSQTAYTYDVFGNVKTLTAPDPDSGFATGPRTTYKYDPTGRTMTGFWDARNPDPNGNGTDRANFTETQFDLAGQLRLLIYADPDPTDDDPTRSRIRYYYDEVGNLLWERDSDHNKIHYTYDNLYRVTELGESTTDDHGTETYRSRQSFEYAESGRLSGHVDALDVARSYEYDGLGRAVTTHLHHQPSNPDSGRFQPGSRFSSSKAEYDGFSRLVATVQPDHLTGEATGSRTEIEYDMLDRSRVVRDALGGEHEYGYNNRGYLKKELDELDRKTIYYHDGFGRVDMVRHGNWTGNTESLAYTQTNYEYDTMNRVTFVTNRLDEEVTYAYDFLSRLDWQQDSEGGIIDYHYDDVGNLTTFTDPIGNETNWEYDARNRVVREWITVDGTVLDRTYKYDQFNNLVEKIDRNDRTTTYDWSFVTDGSGFNYRPETETWLDADGSIAREIAYSYDDGAGETGLLLEELADPDSRIAYDYDQFGRTDRVMDELDAATNTLFILEYKYDRLHRRIESEATFKNLPEPDNGTFGNAGGAATFTPDFLNTYTYDDLHRVDTISQNGISVSAKSVDLNWNADSTLDTISRFENADTSTSVATSEYEYDPNMAGRLTSITHRGFDSGIDTPTTLADYAWTFTRVGLVDTLDSSDGLQHYEYDRNHQLKQVELDGSVTESYQYDANGNRTLPGYGTGDHNRLIEQPSPSGGTYLYEYDNEGNRTSRREFEGSELVEEFVYSWDHRNRLTEVQIFGHAGSETGGDGDHGSSSGGSTGDDSSNGSGSTGGGYDDGSSSGDGYNNTSNGDSNSGGGYGSDPNSGNGGSDPTNGSDPNGGSNSGGTNPGQYTLLKTTNYTYDALDRRISKLVTDNTHPDASSHLRYVYSMIPGSALNHVVMILDVEEDYAVDKRFLHGPIVDQVFAEEDASGNVFWMLTDNQGTVRDVAEYDGNSTTEIVNHLRYDGFGNIQQSDNEGMNPEFTYAGRVWDEDAQLFYNRARWYDPVAGRFASEDPIGFSAGDSNLSRMVGNGTPNAMDPDGLQQSPASSATTLKTSNGRAPLEATLATLQAHEAFNRGIFKGFVQAGFDDFNFSQSISSTAWDIVMEQVLAWSGSVAIPGLPRKRRSTPKTDKLVGDASQLVALNARLHGLITDQVLSMGPCVTHGGANKAGPLDRLIRTVTVSTWGKLEKHLRGIPLERAAEIFGMIVGFAVYIGAEAELGGSGLADDSALAARQTKKLAKEIGVPESVVDDIIEDTGEAFAKATGAPMSGPGKYYRAHLKKRALRKRAESVAPKGIATKVLDPGDLPLGGPKNGKYVGYHGTNSKGATSLTSEGIKSSVLKNADEFNMTIDPRAAARFAADEVATNGGTAKLVRYEIPEELFLDLFNAGHIKPGATGNSLIFNRHAQEAINKTLGL